MASFLQKLRRGFVRRFRYIAAFDIREWISGIRAIYWLLRADQKGRILLIEPNEFHGEILPGICRYFYELGISVTLAVRRANILSGAFSRVPEAERPEIIAMPAPLMARLFRNHRRVGFSRVFLTSSTFAERNGFYGLFFDYARAESALRKSTLLVEHSLPSLVPHLGRGIVSPASVFLLSSAQYDGKDMAVINPHYFGDFARCAKGDRTRFVSVGSFSLRNRSADDLLSAIEAMDASGLDYEVVIVGSGWDAFTPLSRNPRVRVCGRLNFPALFAEMEKSTFFLPLLDPRIEGHRRYLSGETTGSLQLILAFRCVPVMHETFASAYGLDGAALVHGDDSLPSAVLSACLLAPEDYTRRQAVLGHAARSRHDVSLSSLRDRLAVMANSVG